MNIKMDIERELAMLNEALKENDELYEEVKSHYDKVKKGGPGTLSFIEKQTANLISLRSNKVNIIQSIINSKKAKAEIELKVANANKDQNEDDIIIGKIASSIHDLIIKGKGDKSFDELINGVKGNQNQDNDKNEEELEENIDALLENRLKDEEGIDEEVNSEEEQPERFYVVDLDKNIYCVDKDYNIIEDATIPDLNITIIETEDSYIAKDEDGNTYDVVMFE